METHSPAKREKIDQRFVTRSSARKEGARIKFEKFRSALQQPVRFSVKEKRNIAYRHLIGSDPKPSDQKDKKSCYAHAVAKGIVKIIDGYGFDCDQDAVIKSLEDIAGTGPQTYGAFNNIGLIVKIYNKDISRSEWSEDAPIIILSDVEINRLGGVTPRMSKEELTDQHMAMVLTSMSRSHAMYVEHYDTSKQEYHAINSWGQTDARPVIPTADVDSVDYIEIKDALSTKPQRQPFSDLTNDYSPSGRKRKRTLAKQRRQRPYPATSWRTPNPGPRANGLKGSDTDIDTVVDTAIPVSLQSSPPTSPTEGLSI